MTFDELVDDFEVQIIRRLDTYPGQDPECAFAAGMIMMVTALKAQDGGNLPMQLNALHKALKRVSDKRGWQIVRMKDTNLN